MTAQDDGARRDQALNYARTGWKVFPVAPGGKAPAIASPHKGDLEARARCHGECGLDGHGFHDGTTDPGKIRDWWDADPRRNIGIRTGAPHGPDVVDVDNKGPRDNGFGHWTELKRAGLVDNPMALVRSPSGGFHAYFRGTGQTGGQLPAKHIDFRANGGSIIGPGSVVNGKPYELVHHQPSDATVNWQAIRNLLSPQAAPRFQQGPRRELKRSDGEVPEWDTPEAHLDRLARWAGSRQPGDRNFSLYWAAKAAAERGADPRQVYDRMMEAAKTAGLEGGVREAHRTIESGLHDAGAGPAPRPFTPGQPAPSAARPAGGPKVTQADQVTGEPAPQPKEGPSPMSGRNAPAPEITDDTPIGPDVDLSKEALYLPDGTRLTDELLPELADKIRAKAQPELITDPGARDAEIDRLMAELDEPDDSPAPFGGGPLPGDVAELDDGVYLIEGPGPEPAEEPDHGWTPQDNSVARSMAFRIMHPRQSAELNRNLAALQREIAAARETKPDDPEPDMQ